MATPDSSPQQGHPTAASSMFIGLIGAFVAAAAAFMAGCGFFGVLAVYSVSGALATLLWAVCATYLRFEPRGDVELAPQRVRD